MGLVDCSQAPVRVVVGAGARTECPHYEINDTAAAVSPNPDHYFRRKRETH